MLQEIEKCQSLFLYAFQLKDNSSLESLESASSIWKRSKLELDNQSFFPFVHDFFQKNNEKHNLAEIDPSCCLQYELGKENRSEEQRKKLLVVHHLLTRTCEVQLAGAPQPTSFKWVMESSVMAPRLLVNPLTRIVILSFTLALSDEVKTLPQLIEFNFQAKTVGSRSGLSFRIPVKTHPKAQEQETELADILKQMFAEEKHADPQFFSLSIDHCIKLFIHSLDKDESTNQISPNRLQAFTYVQLKEKLPEVDIQVASFRLRRLYNEKYQPYLPYLNERSLETYQSFEQIHYGASIEGCSIIVNENTDLLPAFLKQFDLAVKQRFVWLYLLSYYQRLALISMNNALSDLFEEKDSSLEDLLQHLSELSKIQMRTNFKQVSYLTQHNEFFEFCKENLKLNEMFEDLKDKLADLNRIIQQQSAVEEKKTQLKQEKGRRIIEIMIAALLIPQITFDFMSMLASSFNVQFGLEQRSPVHLFLLVFSFAMLLTAFPFGFRIYKEYFLVLKAFLFGKKDTLEK